MTRQVKEEFHYVHPSIYIFIKDINFRIQEIQATNEVNLIQHAAVPKRTRYRNIEDLLVFEFEELKTRL